MLFSVAAAVALPALAWASPMAESISVKVEPKQKINGTLEYSTQCKKCPYQLCTNVNIPYGGDNITATCWTNGDKIDDDDMWLKTVDNCYVAEYDLKEYAGDWSQDLKYCGKVPKTITTQKSKVRYLSECKWESGTSSETIKYYGRDVDITLTCWVEGSEIVKDKYWYKTTDNCHVSGSGLWGKPDRSRLDNCGPDPYPRANETRRSLDSDIVVPGKTVEVAEETTQPKKKKSGIVTSLLRRWLEPGKIGEEYAACLSCPALAPNATCKQIKRYEFNDTVTSQCVRFEQINFPNGTFEDYYWMLTTDWCYTKSSDFWEPPYDHYRYPSCDNWPGY
ncbi:hypothetical protein VHEMI00052 [[Torrubiella] hemipterigena]|uniref:Cyanovirin-N domain-containing protein n=1 Tax=[Torrubiella] hemipterigena TaxID=1531966 RepID=A0A0A1T139_9HYPO|nr:hypothetical protein VHEMI00052 [[Torrubiella] hemipterigena]